VCVSWVEIMHFCIVIFDILSFFVGFCAYITLIVFRCFMFSFEISYRWKLSAELNDYANIV